MRPKSAVDRIVITTTTAQNTKTENVAVHARNPRNPILPALNRDCSSPVTPLARLRTALFSPFKTSACTKLHRSEYPELDIAPIEGTGIRNPNAVQQSEITFESRNRAMVYNHQTSGDRATVDYSELPANDLFLECLRTGDEPAWSEFVHRFQPLIASVVLRVARQWGESSPNVIDDLIQETYLKLCADRLRIFRSFRPMHPDAVYGYVKVFAANMARDHFKASHAIKRGSLTGTAAPADHAPASVGDLHAQLSVETTLLVGQVTDCLQNVTSGPTAKRDRTIFWLYYRVGLPASAIAKLPTVELSTKGVESTIRRVTGAIREELARRKQSRSALEEQRKGMRPAESF